MASFYCKTADGQGRIRTRWLKETGRDSLRELCEEQGLTLISVIKEKEDAQDRTEGRKKLSPKLTLEFTLTLRSLLAGGITVREALELSLALSPHNAVRSTVRRVLRDIDNGYSLQQALEASGGFSPVYTGLIGAGEHVGNAGAVLDSLVTQMKRSKKIREKITSASIYPLFILTALFTGLILLFLVVLPAAADAFMEIGRSNAGQLSSLADTASGSGKILLVFFGTLILCIIALQTLRTSRFGIAVSIDSLLLSLPIGGRLIGDSQFYIFTSSMASLLNQGMSVEEALGLCGPALSNRALRKGIAELREELEKGRSFYSALEKQTVFPQYMRSWVGIGEQTATVGQIFTQLEAFYADRLDDSIDRLTAAIEPALTVLVGIILIYVLYAFIIPIFGMFTQIL